MVYIPNNVFDSFKNNDFIINDNESMKESRSFSIVVDYKFSTNKTDYSMQKLTDGSQYIKTMNALSDTPIEDLDVEYRHKYHFHRVNQKNSLLINLLSKHLDIKKDDADKIDLYQFSLYSNEECKKLDRENKERIFFILGYEGVIYPIFFDENHQLLKLKTL